MRASARVGRHCESSRSPTLISVGSPCGTTSGSGSRSTRVNVNRSTVRHGESSRAQALAAAVGKNTGSAIAATSGRAAKRAQSRWRGRGTACPRSCRPAASATCRMAASHRLRDRCCSLRLRTISTTPSNWSPSEGNRREISRASRSSPRCRQIQRCTAHGIAAPQASASTNSVHRAAAGVSVRRSAANSTSQATSVPKMARPIASSDLIHQSLRRNESSCCRSCSGNDRPPAASRTCSGILAASWFIRSAPATCDSPRIVPACSRASPAPPGAPTAAAAAPAAGSREVWRSPRERLQVYQAASRCPA